MDETIIDSIFAGSLKSLPPVSSKIVRIFTSSTFTGTLTYFNHKSSILCIFCIFCKFHSDTAMERNTLMAQCYPKLKDYCREKHGLEFQVNIKQLEEFT